MSVILSKISNDEWTFKTRSFVVHVKGEPERAWIESHYDILKEKITRCRTLLEHEISYKVNKCVAKVRLFDGSTLSVTYNRTLLKNHNIDSAKIYMTIQGLPNKNHISLEVFKNIYENLDTIQARFINERQRQERIYDRIHSDIEL